MNTISDQERRAMEATAAAFPHADSRLLRAELGLHLIPVGAPHVPRVGRPSLIARLRRWSHRHWCCTVDGHENEVHD